MFLTSSPGYSNVCLCLVTLGSNLLFYKEKSPIQRHWQSYPGPPLWRATPSLLPARLPNSCPPRLSPSVPGTTQTHRSPNSGFTLKPFCLEKRHLFSVGRLPSPPPQRILPFKHSQASLKLGKSIPITAQFPSCKFCERLSHLLLAGPAEG